MSPQEKPSHKHRLYTLWMSMMVTPEKDIQRRLDPCKEEEFSVRNQRVRDSLGPFASLDLSAANRRKYHLTGMCSGVKLKAATLELRLRPSDGRPPVA